MKRIALIILCLVPSPVWACDHRTALYNTQLTVDFSLYQTSGLELKTDAAHASGDTKVMKDEGAEANTSNGFTDEGQGYAIVLTATEMQAARVTLYVVDQGTKAWIDHCIVIDTYGNASAQHGIPTANLNNSQTLSDLSAPPAAAAGVVDALSFQHMLNRNKRNSHKDTDTTATETLYRDDGSTAAAERSIGDDGTDYDSGEWGTP